jgi:arylsulfatase A-like enzyme
MALTNKKLGLFRRIVSSSRSSFAFAICLAAILLAYRIQLTFGFFSTSVRPFDFNPGIHPVGFMLTYLPYDLSFILICFLASWFFSFAFHSSVRTKTSFVLRIVGLIFLNLTILVLLIVHAAHIRLLFDAQTGLNTAMIREVWMNIPVEELLKFINFKEALMLLLPFGLFWLVLLLPLSWRLWMFRFSVILVMLLSSIWLFAAHGKSQEVPSEIRLNPSLYLISDVTDRAMARLAPHRETRTIKSEDPGFPLTGPSDAHASKPLKWLPVKSARPWNVVFFIMESVGTRYAFDTSSGHPMAMPFLHQLAEEGWYLRKHYTTANISNKAIFSLLSGLYDFFNRETFGVRPDARVPSIYNFLADSYDTFFVTPSPITWYFPTAFIKNSGLPEIHSYDNLNLAVKEEYHSLGHYIGRDETQTVDFFIQRLNRAREPFLGIYLSFAAHLPYFDYGPDYRIREEDGRAISRYYNNLNLLDHMIKRIYDDLKEKGMLERTILVFVGDHGQAFGQHHPDNFMHYRYSYNENLEAPAVLYQPGLFKPRTVDAATQHIDLLPTLLDAMRVPYDPALFDGESLFQNELKRKYLFFYGYEESISALDANQIKVQYSLKKNRCWAFDLKRDPEEKIPLDCSFFQPQLEALRDFAGAHDARLVKYNDSLRDEKEFQGHRHPLLSKFNPPPKEHLNGPPQNR